MTETNKSRIEVDLNPANPGQFFACCGLLELADRVWPGAQGSFDDSLTRFRVSHPDNCCDSIAFLDELGHATLQNTMERAEIDLLETLKAKKTKDLTSKEKAQKKDLESMKREKPLELGEPFALHLNWFHDSHSGGSRFKTWAGQQSVLDIARAMHDPVVDGNYIDVPSTNWLEHYHGDALTFNFDSDASVQGAPLDVGFSLDPLKMSSPSRPLLQLLGFVGLQRFRPRRVKNEDGKRVNKHIYAFWTRPLNLQTATAVASGAVAGLTIARYSFPLLYRTKYLKSFLPAKPYGV